MADLAALTGQIDLLRLDKVVAQLLGQGAVRVTQWRSRPIHGGFDLSNALLHLEGLARVEQGTGPAAEVQPAAVELPAAEELPWTLVIKVIACNADNCDPAGARFWKREALAYQSGFFQRMPAHLAAPRCLAVEERADGTLWIWMETITDDYGGEWTLDTYGEVAYQLGRFDGAFLTGAPRPAEDWFAAEWLRRYVDHAAPAIEFLRKNPTHPLVQSLYGSSVAVILALWEIRGELLDILDRMPQGFCHQDAFKRNLFWHKGQVVAIDWSYAGSAPPGSELVPLVAVSLGFGNIPARKITELDRICFSAYLRGLHDAGARVSARAVRRCYVFTVLLRYVIGGNVGEIFPALLDEKMHNLVELAMDQTAEEAAQTQADIARYYLAMLKEALLLMGLRPLGKICAYLLFPGLARRLFP